MSFDDEIESAKRKLADERGGGAQRRERVDALKTLRQMLDFKIGSRRLEMLLDDDQSADTEPSLVIQHAETGDDLGVVFLDEDGFSFESEEDDYFCDVEATTDAAAFVDQLYESLRDGMPAYELDAEQDGAD